MPMRIPGAPATPPLQRSKSLSSSPYMRGSGSPYHSPYLRGSSSPCSSPNSKRKLKKLERARKNQDKRKVKILQAKQFAEMLTPLYHAFYLFWLNRTKHVDSSMIELWRKLAYKQSESDRLRHGELLVDFMDVNYNEKITKQTFVSSFPSVFNAHIVHQATGSCRQHFTPFPKHGNSSDIFALTLATNGEWAVTGNKDNLLVWELKNGRVKFTLEYKYGVSIKISPDQLFIASLHARESLTLTGDLCLWDCGSLDEDPMIIGEVNGFCFIPFHGHRLCILNGDGSIDVMDINGQVYSTFQIGNPPFKLPTPMVYALDQEKLFIHHDDMRVQIWDMDSQKLWSTLGDKDWLIIDMAISPAEPQLIALLVRDPEFKNAQDIKIFNFMTNQFMYTLKNVTPGSRTSPSPSIPHDITSFQFTTEGHHIYASSSLPDNSEPEIHLFDLMTQEKLKTIKVENPYLVTGLGGTMMTGGTSKNSSPAARTGTSSPGTSLVHPPLPLSGPLAINAHGNILLYCYGKRINIYNVGGYTFPEAPLRKLLWRHLIIDLANIVLDYLRSS